MGIAPAAGPGRNKTCFVTANDTLKEGEAQGLRGVGNFFAIWACFENLLFGGGGKKSFGLGFRAAAPMGMLLQPCREEEDFSRGFRAAAPTGFLMVLSPAPPAGSEGACYGRNLRFLPSNRPDGRPAGPFPLGELASLTEIESRAAPSSTSPRNTPFPFLPPALKRIRRPAACSPKTARHATPLTVRALYTAGHNNRHSHCQADIGHSR